MKIITSRFGEIEYDMNKVVTFFDGLLGFKQFKKFLIIDEKKIKPFQWLQSVENVDLAFVITNPYLFKHDYDFIIPKEDLQNLDVISNKNLRVLTIVVIPKDNLQNVSINLQAPLIINTKDMIGKQIILYDNQLPVKYNIINTLQLHKVETNNQELKSASF